MMRVSDRGLIFTLHSPIKKTRISSSVRHSRFLQKIPLSELLGFADVHSESVTVRHFVSGSEERVLG